MLARLGTKASNQGPVPMMLIRIEAYGPRFVSVVSICFSRACRNVSAVSQLLEGVADLGLVVLGQAAQLDGQPLGVDQQGVDGLAARDQLLEDQLALLHQRDEVAPALARAAW